MAAEIVRMTWNNDMSSAPLDKSVILRFDDVVISGHWNAKILPNGKSWGIPCWEVDGLPSHGCGCCSYDNPAPDAWMEMPE